MRDGTMVIEVQTGHGDVFTVPFPLDDALLDEIMNMDYPDTWIVAMSIKVINK